MDKLMESLQEGIQVLIEDLKSSLSEAKLQPCGACEENTTLRERISSAVVQAEGAKDDWEPQIRWRDERYEAVGMPRRCLWMACGV